jgi:beta propeller repeat protein
MSSFSRRTITLFAIGLAIAAWAAAAAAPAAALITWHVQPFAIPIVDASGAPDSAARVAQQTGPDISADWVVWTDTRDVAAGDANIYGFVFGRPLAPVNALISRDAVDSTLPMAGKQHSAAISENWVIFDSDNSDPALGQQIYGEDLSDDPLLASFGVVTDRSCSQPAAAVGFGAWAQESLGLPVTADVYMTDFLTPPVALSTHGTADISGTNSVAVGADLVVWVDTRNGNRDLYGMYMIEGTEFPVCVVAGDQTRPAVYGDTVVWADHRGADSDIWLARINPATHAVSARLLAGGKGDQTAPDISGGLMTGDPGGPPMYYYTGRPDLVVWEDHTKLATGKDVWAHSLVTGDTFAIAAKPGDQTAPAIDGYTVTWEDARSGQPDVWAARVYRWPGTATLSLQSHSVWTRTADVTLTMGATIANGAVAHTRISTGSDVLVSGAPWSDWQAFAHSAPLILPSGDGRKTISMQYWADLTTSVATVSPVVQLRVTLDTGRPVPRAPRAASVSSGRYVGLVYKVTDALSPTAAVTIRVRTLGGHLVKVIRLGQRPTNRTLVRRYHCLLPRGTYRFYVYARDLAGNIQLKAARNTLFVH